MQGWLLEMATKWQASIAHVFILYQNVRDVVDCQNTTVENHLLSAHFFGGRDIIIKYDRSAGIRFPLGPTHEAEARKLWELDEDMPLPRDPATALSLLEKLLRASKQQGEARVPRCALLIDYAETIWPAGDLSSMSPEDRTALTTILRWTRDPELVALGTPIVLLVEHIEDLHEAIRAAQVEAIRVPLPSYEERLEYIDQLNRQYAETVVIEAAPEEVARLTATLRRINIEDIYLRCEVSGQPLTAQAVKERKNEIVAQEYAEIIEINDPEHGLDNVGGMDHVKEFFRRNVIEPIKRGNYRRVPMGVLLCGPSGTGKTLLAQCAAKDAGLNSVNLNLAKISDKWVGSSERNLEKALNCIRSLAPVLVIIDEIDQLGLSRDSAGDSGVSNRLFKRLLEFMSDTRLRGRVVFVGLTNRPDLMDPALKRPGRFDKKIAITAPNAQERSSILQTILNRYEVKNTLHEFELKEIAEKTDGYTGAELEALVLKAVEIAEDEAMDAGTDEVILHRGHIDTALELYQPTTQDIETMTRLAIREVNDLSLLPPEWRDRIREERAQINRAPFMLENAGVRSRRA